MLIGYQSTAQVYSDLGAWYYGATFKATGDAYLDGFTIYTNAPSPGYAYLRIYGPFTDENEASTLIAGSGSSALSLATPLIKLQAFGTSDFTYSTSPPPVAYSGFLYGLSYWQTDPDIKIVVDDLVEGVEVEEDKYYLLFFAVSNSSYTGNQYRVTRVVTTEPTGSGYELENTYYLHYSSPYQRTISPFLDIELSFTQDNQWTGEADTDWEEGDNWNRGLIPSDFTQVNIAASSNDPVVTTTEEISGLTVDVGATLTITGEVSVTDELSNSGDISGDLVLNGSSAQSPTVGTCENLEVDNSSGVTIDENLSLTGDLTVTSGSIVDVSPTYELSVAGALSNSGTITGDLVLDGSSGQSPTLGTCENLEVDNSSGITVGSDATVTGNFTVNSGTTVDVSSSYEIAVAKVLLNGGTITGDLVLNGSSAQSPTVGTCENLEVDNSSGVTIDENLSLTGDLTVTVGSTVDVSPTYELSVAGALSNSGTITGDLVLNGSSAQSPTLGTVENLEVDNSSGITVGSNVIVTGDLTVTSGSTVAVNSSYELSVAEALSNSGIITGDLVLNGSSAQSPTVGTCENLEVDNSSGVTIAE
ncbi:MAG: hypothetical protein COB15_10720, partial [Flavobacteriales bacterium]